MAAPASGARKMEVATQDDAVIVNQAYFDRERALQLADRLHVSRLRIQVSWKRALGPQGDLARAPSVQRFDFSYLDPAIAAANAHGIKVQLVLNGPGPRFAAKGPFGRVNPNSTHFGKFAAAAAAHFKGRVDRYSIWNEPNLKAWIEPVRSGPKIYRKLYVAGYRAIKRADPKAKVLFGELAPFARKPSQGLAPLRFLRGVLCVDARYKRRSCGGLTADGFAHHPYDMQHKPTYKYPGGDNVTLATLNRLSLALDRLRQLRALRGPRGRKLDLYLTEYGFFGSGKFRISDAKRKKYLVQAFKMAQRNPRVKQMLQYLLIRPPAGTPGDFFATWIVSPDGTPLSPFRALEAWTKSAARRGQIARRR